MRILLIALALLGSSIMPAKATDFEGLAQKLVLEGFGKMDLGLVEQFYAKDENMRFADADGPFHKGFQNYRGWLETVFAQGVTDQSFDMKDINTYAIGPEHHVSTMIIYSTVKQSDQETVYTTRLSLVWRANEKAPFDQEIVHEHFSVYSGRFASKLGYDEFGPIAK